MRSYSVHQARSRFSEVVDRALAGEPQRVTRHGRDTVMIVSEADWLKAGGQISGNLGAALIALGEAGAFADELLERPGWMRGLREFGQDFMQGQDFVQRNDFVQGQGFPQEDASESNISPAD